MAYSENAKSKIQLEMFDENIIVKYSTISLVNLFKSENRRWSGIIMDQLPLFTPHVYNFASLLTLKWIKSFLFLNIYFYCSHIPVIINNTIVNSVSSNLDQGFLANKGIIIISKVMIQLII